MEYRQFIESKKTSVAKTGFNVDESALNAHLFPFQRDIVRWALQLGKAAIFAAVGLGKTAMQLEWASHVARKTNKHVLVLAPLAVSYQTVNEGVKFGIEVIHVSELEDILAYDTPRIFTTNYERLVKFNPELFGGVVLDESSILKSMTGKTKQQIIDMFANTQYKLACTATPAPNDYMEIGTHAEFLNVMSQVEMLSKWFVHDSGSTADWHIKGHAENDFWRWVTSWAVCITKPADLGEHYAVDGYDLPALHIVGHFVASNEDAYTSAWKQGKLLPDTAPSSTELGKVKRQSLHDRIAVAKDIVQSIPDTEPVLIWCILNDEADALKKAFPEAVEIRGADKPEIKAQKLMAFSNGEQRMLITKPSIAGFGMNWQHCNQVIFFGLDFSFESFYQAKGRNHRYGQTREVYAHVIYAETEGNVIETLYRKQSDFETMQEKMAQTMREYGLFRKGVHKMSEQIKRETYGKNWTMLLGDCVERVAELHDESIDFSVYSPPFSNLYVYSDNDADMGNSENDEQFMQHYTYLLREMYRVLKSGRLVAVHCADLPQFKWKDGAVGLKDFSGLIIQAHQQAGFIYHSRITIWKDPVVEMQRTKSIGLLHKQFTKDSTMSRVGIPDYMLIFRKDGINQEPVAQRREHGDYVGTDMPIGTAGTDLSYSIELWQRYASPVWFDIDQGRTLNIQGSKEQNDERHICPLQLDVIGRCIDLWSNKGDTVLSPFAGIGSEGYEAIRLGRKFVGVELKQSYYGMACKNLAEMERKVSQPDLFSFAGLDID